MKPYLFILLTWITLHSKSQDLNTHDWNKYLPAGYKINCVSFANKEKLAFFTAYLDWDHQVPYLMYFESDTVVGKLSELDTIYNGAISPSGNQIIYSIRTDPYTRFYLIRKENDVWSQPISLSDSILSGGYFHWKNENELYFYMPNENGNLYSGYLTDDELFISDTLYHFNTSATEFSPMLAADHSFFIFTRYLEGDSTQQGLMVSFNQGTTQEPIWSEPKKIEKIPYGWGATEYQGRIYFSDGTQIHSLQTKSLEK